MGLFPAHAGVIPYPQSPYASYSTFPRTRGGDPDTLDMLYSLLHHLGYRQSYEEDQMRDGTHELFDKGGDEV